jgi:hypothetical protein
MALVAGEGMRYDAAAIFGRRQPFSAIFRPISAIIGR